MSFGSPLSSSKGNPFQFKTGSRTPAVKFHDGGNDGDYFTEQSSINEPPLSMLLHPSAPSISSDVNPYIFEDLSPRIGLQRPFDRIRGEKVQSYGTYLIPLSSTVILHALFLFSLIPLVCIIPVDSMHISSNKKASASLLYSVAMGVKNSVEEALFVLPVVSESMRTQLMLKNELQLQQWDWSEKDMYQLMQNYCHLLSIPASTSRIIHVSFGCPEDGFSAFCSEYGGQLIGNYIMDGERTGRYLINATDFSYDKSNYEIPFIFPMTPAEYFIEFGSPNNPWEKVAKPYFEGDVGSGELGLYLFREKGRASITYTTPFVSEKGQFCLISTSMQPRTLQNHHSNEVLMGGEEGYSVLFDPETGVVFDFSHAYAPSTLLDNWNYKQEGISPVLRTSDISDPFVKHALDEYYRDSSARNLPVWTKEFAHNDRLSLVISFSISSSPHENFSLTLLYARFDIEKESTWLRFFVFLFIVLILLVIAIADITLTFLLLQPLHHLWMNVIDGGKNVKSVSIVRELARLQDHFYTVHAQLSRMKSFLPHSILAQFPYSGVDSYDEFMQPLNEHCMPDDNRSDAMEIHLNERALIDHINVYRRKYCTTAIFFIHISESEATTSLLGSLTALFLELVIPIVVEHGGVIETQQPDALVTTFGAQRYMAMHQQKAVICALDIQLKVQASSILSPRFAALLDVGEVFIGTCGAAERFARVTYKVSMPTRFDTIKLCKNLGCQTLLTQRLALTLDENFLLFPVDTVKLPQESQPLTFYELRQDARNIEDKLVVDHVRTIIATARKAFEKMSSADYRGALELLETCEKKDRQLARLADLCRRKAQRKDHKPYFRALEHIQYEIPPYDYQRPQPHTTGLSPSLATATTQMPDFDVSQYGCQSLSRIIEASSPIDEGAEGYETNGALFEVVIDGEPPDDEVSGFLPTTSTHSSIASPNTFECVVAGEIPVKFVDRGGTEWTRSSDVLGSGAFASVYRGLSSTGTLAALKCIQLRSKNVALNSISEEIRLFSCLNHENIVQYLSVFVSDAYLIQIMEFVPGGALDCLTKSFGPLPPGSCCRFVRDILCGLFYLHSEGIVHCDIKPHNVLLAMDGQCKLSDFGSAMRGMSADEDIDILELRGTPGYMAPEVANGDLPTPKSDVFSLGVTILELLVGKLPWEYVSPVPEKVESEDGAPISTKAGEEKNSTVSSPLLTDLTELNRNETSDYLPSRFPSLPIAKLLRNPTELVRQIGLGNVVPRIPDTLDEEVASFIQLCICPNPNDRATAEELLHHRWVM